MNQSYARVNQPCATFTLASALREMFGVQLYKNNARALLSHILSILNLDWLQHARSVRGVYEYVISTVFIPLSAHAASNALPANKQDAKAWNLKECSPIFKTWFTTQINVILVHFWWHFLFFEPIINGNWKIKAKYFTPV